MKQEKKQRNRWSGCWNLQNRDREAKTMKIKTDVVIVGTGVAGMFSALKLPRDKKIVIITKEDMRSSDSFLAQGGICVLRDENDYDSYFEDTMKAGHYENRKESVDIMIRGSRDVINDLVGYGVDFKMDGDDFAYTREGAHSKPRILYHEDITGKEISEKLLGQVLKLENVTVLEYTSMQDILVKNGKCIGLKAVSAEANKTRLEAMEAGENVKIQEEIQPGGELPVEIYAEDTILASGGIGGRYQHSTNYPHLTGDALDIILISILPPQAEAEPAAMMDLIPLMLHEQEEVAEVVGVPDGIPQICLQQGAEGGLPPGLPQPLNVADRPGRHTLHDDG